LWYFVNQEFVLPFILQYLAKKGLGRERDSTLLFSRAGKSGAPPFHLLKIRLCIRPLKHGRAAIAEGGLLTQGVDKESVS